MKKLTQAAILVSLTLCLVATAFAQNTAGVTGIVTDPAGGVIAGAEVTLTDTKTAKEQTTTTNDQGVYNFVRMSPGPGYKLTFKAPGFQTLVVDNVALGVGITETHNAQLPVGELTSTVVVTSQSEATLNTTDASIGNVIDQRRLSELPIQLRNSPAALIGLQPGVVGNNVGTATTNRVGSVTGSRADQGNITVDGIDANDQATGQFAATTGNAPIDAIQEFRTVTANPNASEGRSSGGQIEMVTKSGNNEFHGNVREYNRTAATAANTFFNNKNGVRRPQLTRNQFGGSIGGPIKRDRLFFFFDYEGRRDATGVTNLRIVPLNHFRSGSLAFVRATDAAGNACPSNARINSNPGCIGFLSPADIAALDPRHTGPNTAFLNFLNSRYPEANDLTAGNGVNTGGFRFNAPSHRADNTYTSRVDWNPTSNQSLFGRVSIARRLQTDTVNTVAAQFPEDPESGQIVVRDYAWVVGHNWTISPNVVNQATVGVSRSGLLFPAPFAPSFPNVFGAPNSAGGTFGPFSAPFADISFQSRFVPVPTIRDDLTWTKGSHNISLGGSFKPIHQKSSLINDFNFVTIGLGGNTAALNSSLRPTGIRAGTTAAYDSAFAFLLGRYASISTTFVYDTEGVAAAPGTGKSRDYKYDELEVYAQDNWKVRNDLTLTFGLRYQYYSVPYEVNGFQACNDTDFKNLWDIRNRNAANGVSGATSEPFLRYDLCGKGNNARGFYQPDLNNLAPRFYFAYNPGFKDGFLGALFGDRKTSIRGGGSVVYDRVGGGITFIQDQLSYLFDNSAATNFGSANPVTALLNDPRFTSISTLPVTNAPPVITRPFTPFVTDGIPNGNANSSAAFNYTVDQAFRTPYSIEYSFGFQRELPANFLLDVSYVGRQARKLFSQADASQILDFRDPASGQFMLAGFNNLQAQVLANPAILTGDAPATAVPWFENQIFPGGTQFVIDNLGVLIENGDVSDTVSILQAFGFLNHNVGLSDQFPTNIYISNHGSSSYNGLLVSLRKRFSRGLQFDVNYTWSHSIDNGSSVVNTVVGGLVCDLRNLRVCRGNSDFDIRHLVNANFIYELPFGRGRAFGGGAPGWLNQIIGGWQIGGIFAARSGLPFSTTTGSFPVGFTFNSPAVLNGDPSSLRGQIHNAEDGTIQFFNNPLAVFDPANPTAGALRYPRHGEIGNRNILRGPGFWNLDTALLKNFKMPWSETQRLQLRWEAFNIFNHHSFGLPNANVVSSAFGQITTSASAPREMQFALRFEF
jgi:hypothetical protein